METKKMMNTTKMNFMHGQKLWALSEKGLNMHTLQYSKEAGEPRLLPLGFSMTMLLKKKKKN